MSTNKQDKAKQNLPKKIVPLSKKIDSKPQIQWLLRSLLVRGKSNFETGFVLPTVAMVSLVVVLLSVALVVRAFDRSKNASNVRVNQVVLNAATPALDRAKAKLDALFTDPTLPRTTPSDIALDIAIKKSSTSDRYTFGDETRLKLVTEFNGTAGIQKRLSTNTLKLEDDETINTAWKYPVDTDNNGLFDSYTLYGIYFRSPTRNPDGKFNRQRNPLEARTPPMSGGTIGNQCANANATTANLVGDSSWYKSGSKLTKSFYVYTATVPITASPGSGYETYKGNKGFTALEYQQDRSQIPLTNNAVVFQDDLELSPGPDFRLNGRVFTNANLLIGGRDSSNIRLFQVSSKNSCFYKEENAKITVGGNVGTGNINDTTNQRAVAVDLYDGFGNDPVTGKVIDGSNKSTTSTGGAQVGYNDTAYDRRIDLMKRAALAYSTTNPPTTTSVDSVSQYPKEVKESFKAKVSVNASLDKQKVLADEIETYLRDRTRRVPYAEIATPDTNAIGTSTTSNVFSTGIEPPEAWQKPIDANTGLTLSTTQLEQTDPDKQKELGKEVLLGDRVNVGNNLPAYWKDALGKFVTGPFERQYFKSPITPAEVFWTNPNTKTRFRTTNVIKLPDLGISERTGFWEDAAAQTATATSNTGGLRVVTGAGIYVDTEDTATPQNRYFTTLDSGDLSKASFLRKPQLDPGVTANTDIVVWPDTMPMTGGATEAASANRKGDLQMRATAIYHHKDASFTITTNTDYINRTPTACISSYYNPTNSDTAKNTAIDGGYGFDAINGRSNNGVVYPAPYTTDATRVTAVGTYRTQLNRQARLIFPNGRIVNEPLRNALVKIAASGTRSLVDNSAIDTAICGIKILDGTIGSPSNTTIAHGAIKESSFLDARQAKALDRKPGLDTLGNRFIDPISPIDLAATGVDGNYNLQLEQRQPLEIRATDINMGVLRTTTIGGTTNQEYLLPNSGIIYATRDDALLDLSDNTTQKELLSPTDFKLDPTRRPNGIRLINGGNLARVNTFRQEEKGLILVTNLPVYIKGDFNLHRKPEGGALREEFSTTLDNTWSNFYTRTAATLNADFACRINQPGCGSEGDQWRPATIISDATSLMSASFVDGFRDWGDYDLNNNGGSSAIDSRLKNGFFENSFATSSLWWDTGNTGNTPYPSGKPNTPETNPPIINYVSSYLSNGVSPIQRRTGFPVYVMEVCRKLPVSECQPSDWVVGFDSNGDGSLTATEQNIRVDQLGQTLVASGKSDSSGDKILQGTEVGWDTRYSTAGNRKTPLERLGAGTTARQTLAVQDQRYARRVAFSRDRSGALVFNTIGIPPLEKNTAEPLGVDCPLDATGINPIKSGCQYPVLGTWNAGTNYGTSTPNALWFRTTNNITSDPGAVRDITYAADRPLYYTPPRGGKLLLPDTRCFNNTNILDCSNYPTLTTGIVNLNLPTTDQASDYSLCLATSGTNGGSSKAYQISKIPPGGLPGCNTGTVSTIIHAFNQMSNFTAGGYSGDFTTSGNKLNGGTITATSPVVVYDISANVAKSGSILTLDAGTQADAVFVLRLGSFTFGDVSGQDGVKVVVKGVSPNNIFWVGTTGNIKTEDANANNPHKILGNFFGKTAAPAVGKYTEIMGRFLGYNTVPNFFPTPGIGVKIISIASTDQPALAPVLQIHSPGGTPDTAFTGGSIPGSWIQQAGTDTTFNVAFVTGNSPSRPAEESAGLHNFVRFMQNWGAAVNIKGSFIQLRKSAYATDPFSPLRSTGTAPIANPSASNDGSLSIFNYPNTYYPSGGGAGNTLTFYGAPTRQWGFDVALLTQPPDLFAQKFTQRSTSAPDEFFRQVGQDDRWVNNLLCAAQVSGDAYTAAIGDQRPANCPPLSSYND